MGRIRSLRCPACAFEAPNPTLFRCPACNKILEVEIELEDLRSATRATLRRNTETSIWRWFEFFPVESRASIVSLGEGLTPLLRADALGRAIGIARLYLKNDTVLPTGSLKDRSNSVGISRGKELGFQVAAVMSTGNAAASVAAYAAAAGMKAVVMVPAGTAPSKIVQARAHGAAALVIEGDFDREVAAVYKAALNEFGWYDCLSSNPYRDEGKKSYAYELVEQLDPDFPDWVIHPTAGGTGLYAMWKGFGEYRALGWIDRAPRLVAAQSAAAAPIVAAFERGLEDVEPIVARPTVAESIQVGNPVSLGWRALQAIRESRGAAAAVTDPEILEAQRLVGRLAGIFAEPAAATSVAVARKLRAQGVIGAEDLVVCNLTGHGLKQPEAVSLSADELRPIPARVELIRKRLEASAIRR